ncbi:MAG: hypothetical protein ACRC33_02305 [Gemmataceae bacterium]
MRKLIGLLALTLVLITAQYVWAQGVASSTKINKVTVVDLKNGTYSVTAEVTFTLASTAKSMKSSSNYFRDPSKNQVSGNVSTFIPPAPGKTVTITYMPVGGTVAVKGNWQAHSDFTDDAGNAVADTKVFTVP